MDEFDQPPLAPLPTGEVSDAPGATPDALRQILRRHRRRQSAVVAGGLAAVLVAGAATGWAVGRSGRSPGGVQVAAGTPSGKGATPSQSAVAPVPGGAAGGLEIPATGVVNQASGPATQVLLRNASDGTRVRLYEGKVGIPTVTCGGPAACPQLAVACAPSAFVSAEVSDDQVAGVAGGEQWTTTSTDPVDVVSTMVVGADQPQPILVVVGHTSGSTAKVTLTTTYGGDSEAPTGGWVALAEQLPAGFTTDPSTGLPSGSVAALDAGGTTLSSTPLGATVNGRVPPCTSPCPPVEVLPPATSTSSTVIAPDTATTSTVGPANATAPATPVNGAGGTVTACSPTCVGAALGTATTVVVHGPLPAQGCVVSGSSGSSSSGSGYATSGAAGVGGASSGSAVVVPPTTAP
jgi:hypothetical protein